MTINPYLGLLKQCIVYKRKIHILFILLILFDPRIRYNRSCRSHGIRERRRRCASLWERLHSRLLLIFVVWFELKGRWASFWLPLVEGGGVRMEHECSSTNSVPKKIKSRFVTACHNIITEKATERVWNHALGENISTPLGSGCRRM